MKHPFHARAPAFDAQAINDTIQRALASAGIDTAGGPMHEVTQTIQRALAGAGLPAPHESPGEAEPETAGSFSAHWFANDAGGRAYKLYVPPPPASNDAAPALIVMLHGCTQSADDFAAGTRMNRLADTHGFLVVYPEQSAQANPSKCWSWFKPQDQARDAGEPALIAGLVREVAQRHGVDEGRIFVAGLSAGAAMAVVLGETHPELFAAVGAHSGLPYGSAHDVPSALAAMKGGRGALQPKPGLQAPVPLIVFHGDRDHTVQASNAAELVQQAGAAHASTLNITTQQGESRGGQRYSRTLHADAQGRVLIESWTLHGAGHAWSGGDARGSYTDPKGPDASAEKVRFFFTPTTPPPSLA